MALTGSCLHRPEYLTQAKRLAAYTLDRITENGLLYGEGKPRDGAHSPPLPPDRHRL